jgi:hypothetical protein
VLEPAQVTNFNGQVRNLQGQPIANASVIVQTGTPLSVQTDAQGLFQLSGIYEGNYPLLISAAGYANYLGNLQVSAESQHGSIIVMQAPFFSDDFENGMANWTVNGSWGIVANSGSNVLSDSPSGNYSNNQNRSCRLTNPLNLNGISNASLSFRCKYSLENGYDFVYVEVSTNNNNWTQLGSFTGSQSTWTQQNFSLSSYSNTNLYLRFRLSTDSSQTADGIYIDDLQISGVNSNVSIFGDVNANGIVDATDIQAIWTMQ